MDRVAIGLILRGAGGLGVLAVTIWLTRQTLWGFAAMAAWWFAVLIFYDVSMGTRMLHRYAGPGEKFRPAWHGKTMQRLAWLALPMGMVMVLNSLNVEIPRYFLKVFHEEGTLGRFASIAVFLMAGQMIAGALGQTASPRLAKYFLSDRSAYLRLVLKLMAIGAAIGVAGILVAVFLGKFALQILNKEYVQYNWLLTWFMIYGLVLYTGQFLSVAVTASRRFRSQSIIQAGICGLLAFLCLVLIPSHGMVGAVISMMTAMALGYAAYLVVMVRAVRQGPISSA
jgi:O-antigen/teichoic acid export membrane protein